MREPRIVPVDPDGTGHDAMYVVVEHPTGVRYAHQYGGTACLHAQIEGYLVPVASAEARALLDDLFVRELDGIGLPPEPGLLDRVRRAVELIPFQESAGWEGAQARLRVDEARVHLADEAFVPVVTLDGPGVLIWDNSD